MKKILLTSSLVGALALTASADLVVNGDFAADSVSASNNIELSQIIGGTSDWTGRAWSSAGGVLTSTGADGGLDGSMAQVNAITTETGSVFNLTFDWTAAAGATGDALNVNVAVYAWDVNGTGGARFLNGTNGTTLQARVVGDGTSDWTDLGDGSNHSTNALGDPFTVTGTASTVVNSVFSLNFGGANIEDFDYIGIRIRHGETGAFSGGIIDNVAIAVPEPSTYALLGGLAALGFVMTRRRK